MTSIRAQIDAHKPILARAATPDGTKVLVERADLMELMRIADRHVMAEFTRADDHEYTVDAAEFQLLVQDAHEKLHGHSSVEDAGAQRLINAIFGPNQMEALFDLAGPEEPDDDDDDQRGYNEAPESEQTVDEANYRSTAMHYAVQLVGTQIGASHGLAGPEPESVVTVAEKILDFLKG